ncbi:protein kinase domain-containing protein [Rhodococcus koreensis]
MGSGDPLDTQRYPASMAAELAGVGFDSAQEIGRGGFGVVYRCTQGELDRTVAVKVLTVDLDEENRARFLREQQAMGRLTGHPNIVNILQVGVTDGGHPYIVMPYHPRDSLEVRIRDHGALPLDEALRVGIKMAGALESAHRLGILHRDVKPANILLTDYGEPELADFGVAHITGGFETATGVIIGSPAYTAPEVLEGKQPSPASDIYSLGATLFSALTGHAAFERRAGEQIVAQFLRVTTQPVPDLTETGIPDDVAAVISRAMSRSPAQRPASITDFGAELQRTQQHHGLPVDEMVRHVDTNAKRVDTAPEPGTSPPSRKTAPQGNLPLDLTSFVGRRPELAEAKRMLARSRLVTLTGIGGVGKTRLALRVAASAQRSYADGVWMAELGELHDESMLLDTVADALAVQHHSTRPLREVVVEYLMDRELLLVLDNCEHVLDAAAEHIEFLLRVCPRLRVLATSREPLTIGGEAVLRVPPLAMPDGDQPPSLRGLPSYDALTLFAERAAAVVPGFAVTEENAQVIAKICHRLDGLPLPIELAAARLRAMSLEQVLQRLTDRYTLLTRGRRGAPTRQQTLRWCIDWSFELCTAREQLVWGWLSVFAGSFELDAAEFVCGADLSADDLLDTVASLVEKSILIPEDYGPVKRFRVLETLREYGHSKIEVSGEIVSLRRRHRQWCEKVALDSETQWMSAGQRDWIARLKREQPNIREALEFCIDDDPVAGLRIAGGLFLFWSSQGLYSEGRRWLERFLSCASDLPTLERVKALYCVCVMAEVQGDRGAAAGYVEEARTLTVDARDPQMLAFAAFSAGMYALFSGDLTDAHSQLESALADFVDRGDRTHEICVLYPLGLAYELSGMTAKAIECQERVLRLTEEHGEMVYRSHSLWALSISVWRRGETDRSVRLVEEALKLTRIVHSPRVATACLEALAWMTCDLGDVSRSATLMGAAGGLAQSVGSVPVVHSNLVASHQDCEQKVRQQLGGRAFDAAYRRGETLGFEAAIAYALHEQSRTAADRVENAVRLTKRERQVADLIAEGLTNQAIADRLVISPRTVQGHVEHILAKLGFTSRAQVAAWVVQTPPA